MRQDLLLTPEEFREFKHCEKVSYGDITVNEAEWDIMGLLQAQHKKDMEAILLIQQETRQKDYKNMLRNIDVLLKRYNLWTHGETLEYYLHQYTPEQIFSENLGKSGV